MPSNFSFDLQQGRATDAAIIDAVRSGIVVQGSNAWLLACAIVVACVGLNMGSTAVIIGAMLISPLMGPIQGMGLALSLKDGILLKRSLRSFGIMVGISLVVATTYYLLTPVKVLNAELQARTSPTIWDVLIALAGGMAGMIAATRADKGSTVLPGVAIATALMPPLCTVGFGLASMQPAVAAGAAYLFLINAVFIAWAAFVVCNLVGLNASSLSDRVQNTRWRRWITAVILIASVPSIYLAFGFVQSIRFRERAERFVNERMQVRGTYVLRTDVRPSARRVDVTLLGEPLDSASQDSLRSLFRAMVSDKAVLAFNQLEGEEAHGPSPADIQLKRLMERSVTIDQAIDSLQRILAADTVQHDPRSQAERELTLLEPAARRVVLRMLPRHVLEVDLVVGSRLPVGRADHYAEWLRLRTGADSVVMHVSVVR